jgi:hypothetical protein
VTATQGFPTAESALAYRQEHDARVRALYRMTMPTLREIERTQLAQQGTHHVVGGPGGKDELINAILATEYPARLMNEASHVLWHRRGERWDVCDFCSADTGSLETS